LRFSCHEEAELILWPHKIDICEPKYILTCAWFYHAMMDKLMDAVASDTPASVNIQ
jgi:hypothetical protein